MLDNELLYFKYSGIDVITEENPVGFSPREIPPSMAYSWVNDLHALVDRAEDIPTLDQAVQKLISPPHRRRVVDILGQNHIDAFPMNFSDSFLQELIGTGSGYAFIRKGAPDQCRIGFSAKNPGLIKPGDLTMVSFLFSSRETDSMILHAVEMEQTSIALNADVAYRSVLVHLEERQIVGIRDNRGLSRSMVGIKRSMTAQEGREFPPYEGTPEESFFLKYARYAEPKALYIASAQHTEGVTIPDPQSPPLVTRHMMRAKGGPKLGIVQFTSAPSRSEVNQYKDTTHILHDWNSGEEDRYYVLGPDQTEFRYPVGYMTQFMPPDWELFQRFFKEDT